MLHRAKYVSIKNDGELDWRNFVVRFLKILLGTVEQFSPTKTYVYFDRGRSVHRREILESYKGNRVKDPDDPTEITYEKARDFLHNKLPELGIISILEDGIEADDFAFYIGHQYSPDVSGVHISDDKDWYLNLFPNWYLFRAKANDLTSWEDFCKMVGDDKNPRIIYLITRALVGDKSDNIYGLRGFGWETAKKFAPKILYREDLGTSSKAKSINENMDTVRRNISVMDTSWVIRNKEVKDIVKISENNIKEISQPIITWNALVKELGGDSELMSFWTKYQAVVRNNR